MLRLDNVTLFSATSVALPETISALKRSYSQIHFASIKLLSHIRPLGIEDTPIEWIEIPKLNSRSEYSRFILKDLYKHISTEFALCVQWDGFAIRPLAWSTKFLSYDYVGAPWSQFADQWIVGNGGFSLRSKKLLLATTHPSIPVDDAEDVIICRKLRKRLEHDFGIRYAPASEARLFSCERTEAQGDEFGFHGVFNFVSLLGPEQLLGTLKTLPANLINLRDWRQMVKEAIKHRHYKLLLPLVSYLSRGLWIRT